MLNTGTIAVDLSIPCGRKVCAKPGGVARSGGRGFRRGVGMRVCRLLESPWVNSEGCNWMGRNAVLYRPVSGGRQSTH